MIVDTAKVKNLIELVKAYGAACLAAARAETGWDAARFNAESDNLLSEITTRVTQMDLALQSERQLVDRFTGQLSAANMQAALLYNAASWDRPVVDRARKWAASMTAQPSRQVSVAELQLTAAVAEHPGNALPPPQLVFYQPWDTDEVGWTDGNGAAYLDLQAAQLATLESYVSWSTGHDSAEVPGLAAQLRDDLYWLRCDNAWELHGDRAGAHGRSPARAGAGGGGTWRGITIYTVRIDPADTDQVKARLLAVAADDAAAVTR